MQPLPDLDTGRYRHLSAEALDESATIVRRTLYSVIGRCCTLEDAKFAFTAHMPGITTEAQ